MKPLIALSLSRRPLILALFLVFLAAGFVVLQKLDIEGYPDPTPPIIEVIAHYAGSSAEDVEQYVTAPLEASVGDIPYLRSHRSISLPGLSNIKLQFSYQTNDGFAQQQVLDRVSRAQLPNDVKPFVSQTSPTGEVFLYQLKAPKGCSLLELKTLQDWVIKRHLRTVPGVIDVVGWGGLTKEYHIDIDLRKLIEVNIPLQRVFEQVSAANLNLGARTIDVGEQSVNVRGVGLLKTPQDIENIVLAQSAGTPLLLRDVATITVGNRQRSGIVGRDGQPDIVEGIVLMRRGENTLKVVNQIEAEVDRLNKSGELPAGVWIDPFYDRRELIDVTMHTVLEALLLSIVLVFGIQYVFWGDVRAAVIVCATIPAALFFTVILMVIRGDSATLTLLGAMNVGIIVCSNVILVENIYRRLLMSEPFAFLERHVADLFAGQPYRQKLLRMYASCREVHTIVFLSAAVTIASFIPLLTMQGVEGQIFAPLAKLSAIRSTLTVNT